MLSQSDAPTWDLRVEVGWGSCDQRVLREGKLPILGLEMGPGKERHPLKQKQHGPQQGSWQGFFTLVFLELKLGRQGNPILGVSPGSALPRPPSLSPSPCHDGTARQEAETQRQAGCT